MLVAVGPEELGRQLRRARQHRGLSLRDVHAITAIPLPSLAALEEGNLAQLPSPVYARGYVRSYAEAVRLDGDRLALELWRSLEEPRATASATAKAPAKRAREAPPPVRPRVPPRKAAADRRQPSSLAPLRQPASPWVPKGGRRLRPHLPRKRSKSGRFMKSSSARMRTSKPSRFSRAVPALERTAIVILVLVLAAFLWDLQRGEPSRDSKRPAEVSSAGGGAPDTAPTSAPTTVAPARPPVGAAPVADNGGQATYAVGRDRFIVSVAATDAPVWVQVRAAARGPELFQGTLQAGESKPFDAAGTLWVRVGNLGHTAVHVDGTSLTLPVQPSRPYNLLLQR